jgi:hypothetical protein
MPAIFQPLAKPREDYASECDWLAAQVELLEMWRADALEALAENDRVLTAQAHHIAELHIALHKNKNSAWDIYYNTAVLLDAETDANIVKPKAGRKSKKLAAL